MSHQDHQVIITEAPISMENIYKHILQPEVSFIIKANESKLEANILMDYLANIKVKCDMTFSHSDKNVRFEMMKAYMSTKSIVDIPSMAVMSSAIMLWSKGEKDFMNRIVNPSISSDEMDEFVELNSSIIERWKDMLDSMIIYNISISDDYVKVMGHPRDSHKVIDDIKYCGNNFIWLFGIDGFVEEYYQYVEPERFSYFIRQFDEYMFDSANLFKYFMVENNPLPALLSYIGSTPFGEQND